MSLAEDIKQLRGFLGLTQGELGGQLGRTGAAVSLWEMEWNNPSRNMLHRLSRLARQAQAHDLAERFEEAVKGSVEWTSTEKQRVQLQEWLAKQEKGVSPRDCASALGWTVGRSRSRLKELEDHGVARRVRPEKSRYPALWQLVDPA